MINLNELSTQQALSAIYVGYFGRAADPAGQQFWVNEVGTVGLSFTEVGSLFADQDETRDLYPFFADPTSTTPAAFVTQVFLNLFNREPDAAGLEFYTTGIQTALDNGDGIGQIIVDIISGAQDDANGNDRTTLLNKVEVATEFTAAADLEDADFTDDDGSDILALARSITDDVTDEETTVTAARAEIDTFFDDFVAPPVVNPGVPGEQYILTSATDVITGTADDDTFLGYIAQNPFAGGVSNSLSSAERLDGGAGNDRLYAELTKEFVGASAGSNASQALDIQPRLSNIEEIDIEARDDTEDGENDSDTIIIDAKNITDHVEIGSFYSDGDLVIENVTTLTSGGTARNTADLTVKMDHTDNFNSDSDASDLEVLFDNDYLLSGQVADSSVFYFLLDEDAELAGNPDRLNNIDVDGIRFQITNADGTTTDVTIEALAANEAGTHQGFVNALQPALQALINDGTLPAGTTLTLDPTLTDTTFIDDGSRSDPIPAIVLTTGNGAPVEALGFSRIAEPIGEYDVYGRIGEVNEVADQPITIDIDLHKVGRGGDGGNLVIGGKTEVTQPNIAAGIEVFNVDVLGAAETTPDGMAKPSSLGTLTSTGGALATVNIATAAEFRNGTSFASLEIRDGFNAIDSSGESGDLELVNADAFLGDLFLGTSQAIVNLDTLTAQGGGDVTFIGNLNGSETDQAYSYTTGDGEDSVTLFIDGDAVDFANSSVNVATNDGDDSINITLGINGDPDLNNNQLNQAILDNVTVEGGAGADTINVDGVGNATILGGSGADVIYTDGNSAVGSNAIWAFNVDGDRADAQGLGSNPPEDLPGVEPTLAYLGGAVITVTLSGANSDDRSGGVMGDEDGAVRLDDGYESSVTISGLNNGNSFYGDQTDINDAVLEAINEDEVLGKLLTASIGANNTLVVVSSTSGDFAPEDLRIDIQQAARGNTDRANAVRDEARTLFQDSTITVGDLFDGTTGGSPYIGDDFGADLSSSGEADDYYDGLSVVGGDNSADDNLHTEGADSTSETDNVINGGTGNDVIVLSTDAGGNDDDFNFFGNDRGEARFEGMNALINGASNETIELTGASFGDDVVMNFTTADGATFDGDLREEENDDDENDDFDASSGAGGDVSGIDFLDFTAYLTSRTDPSNNTNDISEQLIDVTLVEGTGGDVNANEVRILEFDNTGPAAETFGNLDAADIEALFDGSGATNDYGNLSADLDGVSGQSDDAVADGAASAIIMVENLDNDGDYKVFLATWDASDSAADQDVSVTQLGALDFGDSLDGLTELNLVGSNDYDNLLSTGFQSNFFGGGDFDLV